MCLDSEFCFSYLGKNAQSSQKHQMLIHKCETFVSLWTPPGIDSQSIKTNKTEIEIKGRRKLKQLRYKMIEGSNGNRQDNNPKCKFYSLTHVSPTESAWSSFALIINKARFPRFRKTQSGKLKVLKPLISEEEKRLFSAANWKLSKVFTLPWKFMCTCTFMCPLNVHLFSEKSFPTSSDITW